VVLRGGEAAFRELGDEALDAGLWPVVRRAADLLVSFVDPATGLPRASIDLWETARRAARLLGAAVVGGLRAAALTAARHEPALGDVVRPRLVGDRRRARQAPLGRLARAVSARGEPRTDGPIGQAGRLRVRPLSPYPNRRVGEHRRGRPAPERGALLGLAWPFAPFGGSAAQVRATVDAVERGLATPEDGLRRHEGDTYGGGYEWPLARLWLGLARRALGDGEAASRAVARWSDGGRRSTSCPSRYAPDGASLGHALGWSHAMLLVAARRAGADPDAARGGCRRRPKRMTAAGLSKNSS
jgi:hypothetical protein